MSSVRLFRVMLEVDDLERARDFYGRLFGERPRPVGGGRLYLDCGGVILGILNTGRAAHDSPQDLYFEVGDLEAVHARAEALGALSGADIHGDPGGAIVERPWGERSFYCEDPWRNGLCFVEAGTLFTGER